MCIRDRYLQDRTQFIDGQFVRPPLLDRAGGPVWRGTTVTLHSTNKVYYTLDGSDPRLPGAAISPKALTYTGPITISQNAQLMARAHKPGHTLGPTLSTRSPWSGLTTATYIVD